MFNSFKCILLCNRTATKFHNHFYITSVCHNHGREGEMRNLPGVFLSSRLPRLLVPRVFLGHFSRDHPTRSRNMKHWRNNEVFITLFLLILKKNPLFHLIIPPKRTLFHERQISVTPFPSSGKPRHRLLPAQRILLPLGLTGILEYHNPLPIPTARCPGSRTKSSQK